MLELSAKTPWDRISSSGLTSAGAELQGLVERLRKRLDVFAYKRSKPILWVVFLGGTGTGKSTLFNALCGKDLSATGLERPRTFGPIAYAHAGLSIGEDFPFSATGVRAVGEGDAFEPLVGNPGQLQVVEHRRDELSRVALVDTPDLDSLETGNRRVVEDFYLLADVVVFVTSQEKYADEVPFQFLDQAHRDGKPLFVLLNKTGPGLSSGELVDVVRGHGMELREDVIWTVPFLSPDPGPKITGDPGFCGFSAALFQMLSKSRPEKLLRASRQRGAREIAEEIQCVIDLLEDERREARRWVEDLDLIFKAACRELFEKQEKLFEDESRQYLQNEIRRLYSKYDLLGKPRRFIAQIVLTPLRLLGFQAGRGVESHEEALHRIRRKTDVTPLQGALEGFNRSVLERLTPQASSSPLAEALRAPGLAVTSTEARERVWAVQERLVEWLETTFDALARGIPKSREWGIYSTSVLWGGLILTLETAIGGGISVLEAVLDSAIAPFVTKGAVELFAYHELQRIARELGERYQQGLVSVLRTQRDRYAEALQSLLTPPEVIDSLQALKRSVSG